MDDDISVRQLIFKDFGVDLPISGGTGNSMENAIVVQYGIPNDYVSVEYAYLRYVGIGRRIAWKTIKQKIVHNEGRKYDKITIEVSSDDQEEPHYENYYFDITECFGR